MCSGNEDPKHAQDLNVNSFTIVITLEGIEKIKTSKNDNKTV